MTSSSPERSLHAAFESGDYSELAGRYADGALLDLNVDPDRRVIRGPLEIEAALSERWAGTAEVVEWTSKLHPGGIELWMERVGGDGNAARMRHYLRVADGEITRHWIYGAPPRTPPPGTERDSASLDPALLRGLGQVAEHGPLLSRGWSGNELERVLLADGTRLIAKRVVPGRNWLERRTDDRGREALLFRDGILDRLPRQVDHTIVAAEPDGDAWWVVMRDVSALILPDDHRITREENRRLLDLLALMWEEHWGEEVPHLCSQERRLAAAARFRYGNSERDLNDLLPRQFDVFWEAFAEAVPPDVAAPVLRLVEEPGPLARELDRCGTTMIHGDLRDEQLGILADRLIVLDWGIATQGHPAVDFAWYLVHDAWRTDASHDEMEEDFRGALGPRADQRALDLGMLAGLVMYGWIFGHSAAYHPDPAEREWGRFELDWWVPRARRALETWSPS